MSITHIASVGQLNGILEKQKDKLSVIDFHATWCGPCHAIAPAFEAFSKQYTNVNFMKCDVDAARDVASLYRVSAMPTFIFLRGNTKVDQVRGADKAGLRAAIVKHSSGAAGSGAFSGKGQTLGSGGGGGDIAESSSSLFSNMDPQVRVLLYLLGAYLVFWYLS
ncbi:thioredoxin-like protein [Lentinula edodes]|uniref:Thioredoxin-like protein n=1 Tax=Lentinula lateritia TaxID=40482 RepID=A0A9W9DU91_9AGAR|nr:thioredoxin-domain-containing protein [Lentinula edodes]KAJ4485057.1 thioredoxin-like protein [Lentinula edodes]